VRTKCQGVHLLGSLLALVLGVSPAHAVTGFDPHGSGPGYPECADGRKGSPPSLPAHRVAAGSIKIDGRLDEADWIAAPAATGFTQFEPDRRGEPCEETVFKAIYDDDAVYFGVACCRENGTPVTSCLSRRDHITGSDLIRLYLSPYHDMVTGYHFRINPDGVKEDYYNYDDLYHDVSWDAVWDAKTSIDKDGWYAEIRIPFSSIRYRPAASMTWGLNLFQHIYSTGERTAWSNWDRDQQGFMSRSGTLTGIEGIRPPRQLEITPYVVGGLTDPADPSAHGFGGEDRDLTGNAGVDVKYGVTADLTLNATVQPDFGQVEADPSVLNLSPFETQYEEKRPFFIEGAQFFWHPDFIMFYSRRIGTGSEFSRIRFAGKLTGKAAGDITTAVLVATTDETQKGQAHNPTIGGARKAFYAIGRFGKQFGGEMHSVHIMQTAVVRDRETYFGPTRNGYTTGGDFELNFLDRMYQVTGSFVGSIVDQLPDPADSSHDPGPTYGTGSRFEFEKKSGDWRYALTTRHQGNRLDLNDLGYISDPDHYAVQGWVRRVFNADDAGRSFINGGGAQIRYYRNWIYAARSFADPADPSRELWSYDRGHDLKQECSAEWDLSSRNYWSAYGEFSYELEGTDLYATRWTPDHTQRGPLMTDPASYGGEIGIATDSRKNYTISLHAEGGHSEVGSTGLGIATTISWVQSGRLSSDVSGSFHAGHESDQWVGNFDNPGGGIGGVSYVFAELDHRTWDLTLRNSCLFTRDQSLEIYLQPFLTTGDYANPRELATPDSYDLRPYGGYVPTDDDYAYGAVNLNLVYRWEYRPGSTFYLVWTHARSDYDTRGLHTDGEPFRNDFHLSPLFDTEGENRFLAKVSYWFAI
jgi:hypothetical protein